MDKMALQDAGRAGTVIDRRERMEGNPGSGPPRKSLTPVLVFLAAGFLLLIGIPIAKSLFTTSLRIGGSKVRTENRALAEALETYRDVHGAYPFGIPFESRRIIRHDSTPLLALDLQGLGLEPASIGFRLGWDDNTYEGEYDYRDWFSSGVYHRAALPYRYYPKTGGWILISTGPDGDYDIDPEADYDPGIPQPSAHLLAVAGTYDPTNGTESDGDLWQVKM